MFDCPNCGETVDDGSSFCPHCGSDAETGWKPDADYYGLDLPEDGDFDLDQQAGYGEDPATRLRGMVGPVLVVLCFILFASVGYKHYDKWIIIPSIFIMLMTLLCLRVVGRTHPERRS